MLFLGRNEDEVDYAGDNFVRVTGDTVEHARAQLFAWEAGFKGLDVQALAEPTKLEALKREYMTKKTELKDESKSKIFDKYGGNVLIIFLISRKKIISFHNFNIIYFDLTNFFSLFRRRTFTSSTKRIDFCPNRTICGIFTDGKSDQRTRKFR